jgi:hypothetical protein
MDTSTAQINKLSSSPDMIEALQQLKYSFREDRQSLDSVSHLQAKESDCGIDGKLSAYTIDEPYKQVGRTLGPTTELPFGGIGTNRIRF